MKKEIYNNFVKKINKNLLSSHKINYYEECSLTPFLSLKYERNENNNFYNILKSILVIIIMKIKLK